MGDGGVACIHFQQHNSNLIMERFSTPNSSTLTASNAPAAISLPADTTIDSSCNGSSVNNNISNNGNGSSSNVKSNGVNSKPKRIVKKIIKVKKLVSGKKVVVQRTEVVKSVKTVVGNGTSSAAGVVRKSKGVEVKKEENKVESVKDEVEEGELGSLKWPPPPPPPKAEVENGEFVPSRRGEIEEKWRKGEVEKGEIGVTGKWRKGEVGRDEIEKGEFIPDRWHDYNYGKARGRYDAFTPPSVKYSADEVYRRKELTRSGSSQQNKSLARWEFAQEKNIRLSSKIVDEEGVYKGEYNNGKGYCREYVSSGNRLKRHGADSDGSERKHYGDYGDYVGSKSRRLSDEATRSGNPDHYSHHSVDRFHRNSSSSRVSSLEKYSLRNHEPTLSSKVVYDRHPRSPGYSERSPRDKARLYDYRDRSPVRREKSPYGREKSPYGREKSPYGREKSPYGRDRSPYVRERTPYGRERSPYGREKSPYGRERTPYGGDRAPYGRERSPYVREKSPYGRERSPYAREKSPYGRERSPYVREKSPYGRERSPYVREKSPYGRERSPYGSERSPFVRDRSPYGRERSPYVPDRSPYGRERSPYGRSHHYDHRNRSPTYSERSSYDRAPCHDFRERTPSYMEKSPLDRGRANNHGEGSRKGGANEKHGSQHGNKGQDDKLGHKETAEKDSHVSTEESPENKSFTDDVSALDEKTVDSGTHKEEQSQSPSTNIKESPHAVEPPVEELQSMEEDMDICDTPPHVAAPVVSDTIPGKWYYLDYFGVERGPSKLSDLKALVSEGFLASDHMVKHLDSDRWVTAENAVSPLVTVNFQIVVSETITQLVTPPEAPGNVLEDSADIGQSVVSSREESPAVVDSEPLKDLHIDERVGALLDGFTVIPGREVETIGDILHTTFENVQLEGWGKSEDFACHIADDGVDHGQTCDELLQSSDIKVKEDEGSVSLLADGDHEFSSFVGTADWFSDRWSCKGGDWKRNDENAQERFSRRKLVLNDGFPLCQMPKAGSEDPRWHGKDDLYNPSQSRRLDLPPWAFSCSDERNEVGVVARATVNKPPIAKVVKGTMLPVVRINACVVKDHGSFVSEPRMKVRGKDKYLSRSARAQSVTSEVKRSTMESDSRSRALHGQESSDSWSGALIRVPKGRLCTVDDLQLQFGEWYYLDGTGHERGPLSFSDLQVLAAQSIIQKHSSVYRKFDRVWVPINSILGATEATLGTDKDSVVPSASLSLSTSQSAAINGSSKNSSSFHSSHPQFIGYTRGKLHELVMKSFKSREFAGAINEVLDPWIIAKQPKKESDKHIYRRSETDARGGKRSRMQVDDSDEDYEVEEDIPKDETPFEDLCSNASFCEVQGSISESEVGNWGLLDGHMLARIFHFLRSDIKSLALASLTCKHWRAAVSFYKAISRQVDLSSIGPKCTDSTIWSVTDGYNKENVTSMVLFGCTNISSPVLDEILRSFPCLSSVDIRGCSQLIDLPIRFPNISWVKRCLPGMRSSEDSSSRIRTLKQLSEKTLVPYKPMALGGDFDLTEYFDSVNKRDSANQFRGSLYRRSKLLDARKSSSIISRDARMKRWAMKKSANGYKRMEGFLASGLKDIMKENIFEFFVPKVTEIEDRMKNGYYLGHGLKSVKEDISRMCRDAIKAKSRGGGDMNHIITLFLKLASRLEESSRFSYERDELMKSWKDDLSAELGSASMKYTKKMMSERKLMNRSNGATNSNGGFDYGEYASDREIRKRLSKLNRKSMDSGSETSDEFDKSSEYGKSDGESAASDTESDLDFQSESRIQESKDGYFTADETYDGMGDEREWGARMTKASLVPPVTRKYEVIDHYVIVADEEDVKRKMSVSLPDNYAEKLETQKNGTEELELPEVKDFKPRKQLGDEVIEQEVYGIDPYTYNLLLDSMPDEVDMSAKEKHSFIEDVILSTLNKQVRHFTGTGHTPMTYPLLPVIEQIEQDAAEDGDIRIIKLCRGILKAIDSRPDDNYVAYRKGLGVVCNKRGGIGEEDFVVEFLGEVYPVWKWFEKQDGIRSLQKDSKEPAPEFYNIYLERPKGDADGYDLVVVDAMHKANYASRICHSCKPNCEAKVTAVDGKYQIGIYAVRKIQYGEEVTFDYNSVTESKEEYEASVCLCGSQVCRGSYLNLTGEGAFQKVMKEWHGMLDRCSLMLEACDLNCVSEEDYLDLGRAGLGSCLLGGLPDWVVAYSARLVRFINRERVKLPEEILKHNIEEKRKYFLECNLETERQYAEIEAEGVHNQRLQNLALTLDKVRYVMRCVFGDPKTAPPPLEKLSPEETVSFVWKGEGSLVEELLQCMAPHLEASVLSDLISEIRAHDPSDSHNIQKELQKSLLWLRDAIRCLPCTHKSRHDAAADLIHVYAYTKYFFRIREYNSFTSPPLYISPLDLGPKYADKVGADGHEYEKTYGGNYCLGQLIFWHLQTNADPDCNLARASRGCLSLPDIGSFYPKAQKPSQQRIYGPKTVKTMLERMERYPQKPWPKDQIWSFKSSPKIMGTPMLDCVIDNTNSLDKEMLHWLKHKQ